ncbi:hypothetical protein ACIRVK_40765 [Streptomyces sp. NPDC101152]|uniref:hypothetical protein n=1 Tax=Streptomyces sp. NPDC101152 TaxID=3366116 RepID=UPI0037FA109E
MGILGPSKDAIPVLRDADVIAAVLRQALADAPLEERAGLEGAVAIAESTAAATEAEVRARWVRSRLAAVGFTGDVASVAAVKVLRQAEPGLSLVAAVQLQENAVAYRE